MIYEKISSRQLLLSVICFLTSASLMTDYWFALTGHDTWFVVLLAGLLCLLFSLLYLELARRFPGCTLIQINELVYGKVLGKTISLSYVFFFLTICSIGVRSVGSFVVSYMMPETPMEVVLIMLLLVCSWASREGIRCLTGLSTAIVLIALVSFVFTTVLLLPNINVEHFLPLLRQEPLAYGKASLLIALVPFSECMVFLMIFPFSVDPGKTRRTFLVGIALGVLFVLLLVLRDTAVLGLLSNYVSLPTYESLRMIQVGEVLTRIEVLYSFGLVLLFFFHVSLFLYAAATAVAQICGLRSHKALVHPMAVLVLVYGMLCFESNIQRLNWSMRVEPWYNLLMELVLPLITLVIGAWRFRTNDRKELAQ